MEVNCGKCEYCRKLWINDWATRLQMQKQMSYLTLCMTLTYNQENLPISENGCPTLSKDDIQKFFKRVRKTISKDYKDVSIQYFISGEYGSSYLRPHYHLILYINTNNKSYTKYDFQTICLDKWKKGYIDFKPTSNLSVRYLAKYMGKTTGVSEYAESNNLPLPFILMSRRPAIGAKYLEIGNNFEQHFKSLEDCKIHLPGLGSYLIPRYIRRKVTEHLPKEYKKQYYQKLIDKQIEEYENKILENCRTSDRSDYYTVQLNRQILCEQQRDRKQREQQQAILSKQIEDINYLKLHKKK